MSGNYSIMTTLNLALVGCGGRGTGASLNCLKSKRATARIISIADAFPDRLVTYLNTMKAVSPIPVDVPATRQFAGLEAYKAAIDLADAVVLATPPAFYPEHLAYAISKGKHVFMEKPVAVDSPGVRSVLASAREADTRMLSISVGLQDWHNEGMVQTVDRIRSGALGRILFARGNYEKELNWLPKRQASDPELSAQIRDWYYYPWLSGDHIVEQNVHIVSNVCWVLGGFPLSCQGMGGRQVRIEKEYGQIFDHHSVEYLFENGCRFFNRCRQISGAAVNIGEHFVGDQGTCNLRNFEIVGKNPWKYTGSTPEPYQAEVDVWLQSIVDGKPLNEAYEGAWVTLAAIMGRMASYSGRVVTWEDALNSQEDLAPDIHSFNQTPPVLPDARGFYPAILPGGGASAEAIQNSPDPTLHLLRFQGLSGARYQMYSASNATGPWSKSGSIISATGNVEQIKASSPSKAKGFYRFEKL